MVMHAVQGNKSKAAQVLGIGRKTLYRKLEEYRLTEAGGQELRVLNK
jgi:two-component system NtrC family response regulator